MVSMPVVGAIRLPMASPMSAPVAQRCSPSGKVRDQELPSIRQAFVRLSAEWECLERLDLSQDGVHTFQGARAASTRVCYTVEWIAFYCWCVDRGLDLIACPLPHVLSSLLLLQVSF